MVPKSWRRKICSCLCVRLVWNLYVLLLFSAEILFFSLVSVENDTRDWTKPRQEQQISKSQFLSPQNSHTQFHLNVKICILGRKYYHSRGHTDTHTHTHTELIETERNTRFHANTSETLNINAKAEESFVRVILTLIEQFLNSRWVIAGCFIVCKQLIVYIEIKYSLARCKRMNENSTIGTNNCVLRKNKIDEKNIITFAYKRMG